jgi:pimeloyl-ACP methyl ester carboxylesterase
VNRTPLAVPAFALLLAGLGTASPGADRSIDVGGGRLRARVLGEGRPAVVFESGGGGASLEEWGRLPELVASSTRVVVYDRAGIGGSDPATTPRTGETVARELHALLGRLDVEPPYVLVGHSLGGLHVRYFASLFPEEVAGFVFLDPTTEEMRPKLDTEADRARFAAQLAHLPPGARAEMEALAANVDGLGRLGAPPDRPAVVVSAAAPPRIPPSEREAMAAAGLTEERLLSIQARVKEQHARLAARFPRGRHVELAGSGHAVHRDEPERTRDEILEVLKEARRAKKEGATRPAIPQSPARTRAS